MLISLSFLSRLSSVAVSFFSLSGAFLSIFAVLFVPFLCFCQLQFFCTAVLLSFDAAVLRFWSRRGIGVDWRGANENYR